MERQMPTRINLNADMGEGWGAYEIGNDMALVRIVRSANVACGFHAGDWNTMHRLCEAAKARRLQHRRASRLQRRVGLRPPRDAHGPGRGRAHDRLPDRRVAGDRRLLRAAGHAPQGARRAEQHGGAEDGYALALGRAIKAVDPSIIYVAQAATAMERAARDARPADWRARASPTASTRTT